MRLAALDLGSNSFHALVADAEPGGELAVVERAKRMPRIGEAIFRTGRLSGAARDKALQALAELVPMIERNRPHAVLAVATSAVREARNGRAFVAEVRARFGFDVQVISGDTEARLCYAGARSRLGGGLGRATLFDLGGGSLEVVAGDRGGVLRTASAPLGVLRALAESPLSVPPSPRERRELESWAHDGVAALLKPFLSSVNLDSVRRPSPKGLHSASRAPSPRTMDLGEIVFCAGTARALRSMARALGLMPAAGQGADRLSRDTLSQLIEDLAPLPLAARRSFPGLDPARADLIVHGAVILASVLAITGASGARVCRAGLREGLILEHARRQWASAA